ncbi:hypothetical protein PG996_003051 [Apiospora saccharicola]|uniref:Uncharacterized protein n=1 Tax=Apiospora saccharicola TaxID=335842 RepID=A0ABR1W2S1_9PEZI
MATAVAVHGEEQVKQARAAAPTIPTYASFCTEQFPGATPHYSSACWSITASTTTLPPQTVAATATATATKTVTVIVAQTVTQTATSTTTTTTTTKATATTTVAPLVSTCARPQDCDTTGVYGTSCGSQTCFCLKDAEGRPTCYGTDTSTCTDFQRCAASSDCAQGLTCAVGSCCHYGICARPTAGASCPNPSFARAIFARKQNARDEVARSAAAAALYDNDGDEDEEEEEEEAEGDGFDNGDEDEDEDEEEEEEDAAANLVKAKAAAAVEPTDTPPIVTSVIMCIDGPCGTTTITGSTPTAEATPPPTEAFGRRRRGEAFEAVPVSTYTSVIMCIDGPCGTTVVTVQPQTTIA